MLFYVYCIFFDKEKFGFKQNHYYIGQHKTKNLNDKYMGSGKKVKDIYKKYGKDKAEKKLLAITGDEKSCNILEVFFIKEYIKIYGNKQVLNITEGGVGIRIMDSIFKSEILRKSHNSLKKHWKEHPEDFLERNKKISKKLLGNKNGTFRKNTKCSEETKKKISKTLKSKIDFGEKVSKAQMEKVYFYSLEIKIYKEYESIKTCWREMGFSSESTALRHCRYCTNLIELNILDKFETMKAVKIFAFVSKIPFGDKLKNIQLILEKDKNSRKERLYNLELERRKKIAEFNLTKRDYSSRRKKEVIASC